MYSVDLLEMSKASLPVFVPGWWPVGKGTWDVGGQHISHGTDDAWSAGFVRSIEREQMCRDTSDSLQGGCVLMGQEGQLPDGGVWLG